MSSIGIRILQGFLIEYNLEWEYFILNNCNFDEVTLVNCIFNYCKFEGCFIKYNDLLQFLSKRPNKRWKLCKNLFLECLKLGYEDEYRKYNAIDQLSGLGNYILSKANKILCGCPACNQRRLDN